MIAIRKRRRWAALLPILTALLISAACGGSAGGGIVYVSETPARDGRPGAATIYVVAPGAGDDAPGEPVAISSRAAPLSNGVESGPRWDPDGQRIAFVSNEAGRRDIMVADANGEGGAVRITSADGGGPGRHRTPRWSADGERVAYVSDTDGHSDIYISRLESGAAAPSAPVRITSADTDEILGDWSPDGQWLIFARRGGAKTQGLWLRNPDGVNLLRLTEGNDLAPVWSPDDDAIAFVRQVDGHSDIYLLRPPDNGDWRGDVTAEALIESPAADHSPAWAPDGDKLVFVSTRDGNPEIYVFDTDTGGPPQRLTVNEIADSQPVWSPDGAQIAFVSRLHGQSEIYAMDRDGANQRRLTRNDAQDHSPDW